MLTLQYLKDLISVREVPVPEITDLEDQVIESDAGYDGIVELIEQRPDGDTVIILEPGDSGSFGCNPDGVQHQSQVIWCVAKVGAMEAKKMEQKAMFSLMKRLVSLFIKHHKNIHLKGWDSSHIPWLVTNAGSNCTGYQFSMYFDEVTDLTVERFRQ